MDDYTNEAVLWASKLKEALTSLGWVNPSRTMFVTTITDEELLWLPFDRISISKDLSRLPRRRRAPEEEVEKANCIANLLYPAPKDSLGPIIKYARDRTRVMNWLKLRNRWDILHATKLLEQDRTVVRLRTRGPWDPEANPISLDGPYSLPMPVEVSNAEDLEPLFNHLKCDGNSHWNSDTLFYKAKVIEEPVYRTQALEFPKGVVYEDGRMDLCKMVVGPKHIDHLIESLRMNMFVKHFLLGNNIIGPHGAKSIAAFIQDFPNRIDTWYLAGNVINGTSLGLLVNAFVTSTSSVTNIWLKRNPLGSNAASDLFRLITETPNLRTLDLDVTELGDIGVSDLFFRLSGHTKRIALENIYLNANGIGPKAAAAIGQYLACQYCTITSMYMSNNPLGNDGYHGLADGLRANRSLKRLCLQSTGLSDEGAALLFSSLQNHPALIMLDVGQSIATQDLGQAYNYLTDACAPAIADLLARCTTLEYFNIGSCAMKHQGVNLILREASYHPSLLQLNVSSDGPHRFDCHADIEAGCHLQEHRRLSDLLILRVCDNVDRKHKDMSYRKWVNTEKRWVVSDRIDVRKIDSVYRNRDMAMARKGMKKLKKWWDEDDSTLEEIMGAAAGSVCTSKRGSEMMVVDSGVYAPLWSIDR